MFRKLVKYKWYRGPFGKQRKLILQSKKIDKIKDGTNFALCIGTQFKTGNKQSRKAKNWPKHRIQLKIRGIPKGSAGRKKLDWKDSNFKALKGTLEIEEGDNVWINYSATRPGLKDSDLATTAQCSLQTQQQDLVTCKKFLKNMLKKGLGEGELLQRAYNKLVGCDKKCRKKKKTEIW